MNCTGIAEKDLLIVQKFEKLLSSKPQEEEIHQFIVNNHSVLAFLNRAPPSNRGCISGMFSKFPITPDRIPDFTIAFIPVYFSQLSREIVFVELKKADARLFVKNGRMSQDLNDAWTECLENIRLMGQTYDDFIRRLANKNGGSELSEGYNWYMSELVKSGCISSSVIPEVSCVVFIGRRANLSLEQILRLQTLRSSTSQAVKVYTYDALIDFIYPKTEGKRERAIREGYKYGM